MDIKRIGKDNISIN